MGALATKGFLQKLAQALGSTCHTTCPAQLPRLLSFALLPSVDVATTASAPGKGEVVPKLGRSRQRRVPGCPLPPSPPFLVPADVLPWELGPLLPARAACSRGALPAPAGHGSCLALVSLGSARPSACRLLAAGLAAGRSLLPRQALGFVTHGRALRRGPLLLGGEELSGRFGFAWCLWGDAGAAGLGAGGLCHALSSTARPGVGIPGRTPPVLLQEPPWCVAVLPGAELLTGTAPGQAEPVGVHRARHPPLPTPRHSRLVSPSTFPHAVLVATRPPAPDA